MDERERILRMKALVDMIAVYVEALSSIANPAGVKTLCEVANLAQEAIQSAKGIQLACLAKIDPWRFPNG